MVSYGVVKKNTIMMIAKVLGKNINIVLKKNCIICK